MGTQSRARNERRERARRLKTAVEAGWLMPPPPAPPPAWWQRPSIVALALAFALAAGLAVPQAWLVGVTSRARAAGAAVTRWIAR